MRAILFVFFSCLVSPVFSSTFSYDSIGVEEVEGQVYILHRVETKETLYSVSRRYDVPINKIIKSNPPTEYGLEVGQVIKIPYLKKKKKDKQKSAETIPEPQKNENDHQDVLHTVASKETLYSISRQYDVTVEQIKQWNKLTSNSLDIGQQLVIRSEVRKPEKESEEQVINTVNKKTHRVKESETLYSISRQYEISVSDLKQWNELPTNEISIGQELIVGNGEKLTPGDELPDDTILIEEDDKTVVTNRVDSALVARNKADSKIERTEERVSDQSTSEFGEIIERGVAALIEGSENTRKYLALHRTAKVGTIMRIRNEMNGQEVFVRVLGQLPDTGVNQNVVIRISKSAYNRLGAIDPKFRVKVSYIP